MQWPAPDRSGNVSAEPEKEGVDMKTRLTPVRLVIIAGLLGATLLGGAPASARPAHPKWGAPKQAARGYGWHRGQQRVWRQVPGYGRYYRDRVIIYDGYRGRRHEAYRYWFPPYYRGSYIYVRPVRYWAYAGAHVGGVSISVGYHGGDNCFFGCNFCDARFGVYADWAGHVGHCGQAPRGYAVRACAWDDDLDRYGDRGWNDAGDEEWSERYDR
jgi:hypothetical protein